jgi:hypothetical protein
MILPDGDEIKLTFPLDRVLATPADRSTKMAFSFTLGDKRWTGSSDGGLRQVAPAVQEIYPWENSLTTAWYFTTSEDADASKAAHELKVACKDFLERHLNLTEPIGVDDDGWPQEYLGRLTTELYDVGRMQAVAPWTTVIRTVEEIKSRLADSDSIFQVLEEGLDQLEEAITLTKSYS